jgi:hypothetical protein
VSIRSSARAAGIVGRWTCCLALSLALLKYVRFPCIWIALVIIGGLVFEAVCSKSRVTRRFLVSTIAVVLAIGVCEAYFLILTTWQGHDYWCEIKYPRGYFQRDDLLGTVPAPDFVASSIRRTCGKKVLYEVTYSIGLSGLRVGPPRQGEVSAGAVLFFGGSFTFGEGVNDDETLPYRVNELLDGKYRTYNFGFPGYGPHQMLALLEAEREVPIVNEPPRYVIFQALRDHIRRVRGLVPYGTAGPRYVYDEKAGLVRAGRLGDVATWQERVLARLATQMNKSAILRMVLARRQADTRRADTKSDAKLCARIIAKSRDLIEGRYPGSEFHVIYWDNTYLDRNQHERDQSRTLVSEMRRMDIPVHLVSGILPDWNNEAQYGLDPLDVHPNPLAYSILAEYVSEEIIGSGRPMAD